MKKRIEKSLFSSGRIFILPTKLGFYFLAITFILFTFSLSYGNPLAYTATFIFSSCLVASTIFTNYNLSGVSAKILDQSSSYFADDLKLLPISLVNISKKVRFDLEAEIIKIKSSNSLSLDSKESKQIQVILPNLVRGKYKLQRVKIYSSFPFGLFYSWRYINLNHEINIYPRAFGELPAIESNNSQITSDSPLYQEGNEDFYQHTNYGPGESWKRINWQVWAKTDDLIIKQFHSPTMKVFSFDHSTLNSLNEEEALEQMSKWIKTAMKENAAFSLTIGNIQIPYGSGENHYHRALATVASYNKEVVEL